MNPPLRPASAARVRAMARQVLGAYGDPAAQGGLLVSAWVGLTPEDCDRLMDCVCLTPQDGRQGAGGPRGGSGIDPAAWAFLGGPAAPEGGDGRGD